jgi:cation-transporting ATPase E
MQIMKEIEDGNRGLTSEQVEERKSRGLVNTFQDSNQKSLFSVLMYHFWDLPNIIIFVSCGFLVFYQRYQDAVFISLIVAFNLIAAVLEEIHARKALARINVVTKRPVKVIRDGKEIEISPEEIVQDDILPIESGNYLYIDGELLEAEALLIDESVLTGESDFVKKSAGSEVLSGSYIVAGKGLVKATKVGDASFLSKVTIEARKYEHALSPIQENINWIVKIMTVVSLFVIGLLLAINFVALNAEPGEIFNSVISIVVSMVPQGIVLTLTLGYIIGIVKMYRKGILVHRANSVESLAKVDVLCMDKTGTITENKLSLKDLIELPVNNDYQDIISATPQELLKLFLEQTVEKNKTILATQAGLDSNVGNVVEGELVLTEQVPFTSERKYSAIEYKLKNGKSLRLLFGAPDRFYELMPDKDSKEIQEIEEKQSHKGYRNLLFCVVIAKDTKKDIEHAESIKQELISEELQTWVADAHFLPLLMVSIEDKLRDGAKDIINKFIDSDIKPVLISGDGEKTLLAIIQTLNLSQLQHVITGPKLEELRLSDGTYPDLSQYDVFARVTPEQKREVIKNMQARGLKVGMIGDGVNDAFALKQADLSISISSGADVCKNIADVVLLNDDLTKLADVIEEGRVLIFNSLKSAKILVIKNVYAMIIITCSIILGLAFPFSPRGLFLISYLNGSIPTLIAILQNKGRKDLDYMASLLQFSVIGGALTGVIGTIMYLFALYSGWNYQQGQTILLSFIVFTGIVNTIFVLSDSLDILAVFKNKAVLAAVIATMVVYAFISSWPVAQEILNLVPIYQFQWLVAGFGCLIYMILLIGLLKSIPASKFERFNLKG